MSSRKRSPSAGLIGNARRVRGLTMSNSVSNISFRYHPEDEQLDDNYETSTSISVKSETPSEEHSSGTATEPQSSVLGRLVGEDPDKWFNKVKGRITKSVEKIEEIKWSDKLKNQGKQRRSILSQMENSSVSDSEEQSESSPLSSKSAPVQGTTTKTEKTDDKLESDVSGSQASTPDRSTTPVPSPEDVQDEDVPESLGKKGKGLKAVLKRKKGKLKNEKAGPLDKTTIAYSDLCGEDTDSEATVEVGQDVMEEPDDMLDSSFARDLERLANPSMVYWFWTVLYDWHIFILPLAAISLNWAIQLPQYMVGLIVGAVGVMILQRILALLKFLFGPGEPAIRDLLPFSEVPIFRRSVYETDIADKHFAGWMNEYCREYVPETYHVTLTETVYVQLDGSRLRLSTPRTKVPKRALWSEPRYKLHFNREKLFDIAGCRVQLVPEGLILRRRWSKKYPICISLTQKSRLGVRHRHKSEDTVKEDAPWFPEEEYTFDTLSEDSEEEHSRPSGSSVKKSESDILGLNLESLNEDDLSLDSRMSESLADDFVKITASQPNETLLHLFARTDREKEIWFRRLVAASAAGGKKSPTTNSNLMSQYLKSMLQLSQRTTAHLPSNKQNNQKITTADLSISTDMMWLNAFLGRTLFDVFRDQAKLVEIQEKIQRKLTAIKLPIFLEQLEVSHLDLGESVPVVQRATRPTLNAQGIWVDLDIVYEGGFKMVIDTKVNLSRIKQLQGETPESGSPDRNSMQKTERKSAIYDSDVEDSAETSGEEPDLSRLQETPGASGSAQTGPKFIRMLDKFATSKYVQQVVDHKFIKKLVTGNSLQLVVEVKGLLGTLVLNIPPPPTDRLWYGFRTNPKLWLSAHPKFGQHAFHVISRIIEKKLSLEFQRILVLPNMDDLLIPVMDHSMPS